MPPSDQPSSAAPRGTCGNTAAPGRRDRGSRPATRCGRGPAGRRTCRRAWRASSSSHGPHMPPCSAQPCSSTRSGPVAADLDVQRSWLQCPAGPRRAGPAPRAADRRRRRVCAAENVTRRRDVPAGTVGGRIAGTQRPRASSASLAASAAASLPSSIGWIGVARGQQRAGRAPRAARGSARRDRALARAARARRCSTSQRCARRARPRPAAAPSCRCRCARAGAASRSAPRVPATKAPKVPKALPSVPISTGTSSSAEAGCSTTPPPGRAEHAEAVRVVDEQPGAVLRGTRRASSRSGARSPSMLNTPSVTTSACACRRRVRAARAALAASACAIAREARAARRARRRAARRG